MQDSFDKQQQSVLVCHKLIEITDRFWFTAPPNAEEDAVRLGAMDVPNRLPNPFWKRVNRAQNKQSTPRLECGYHVVIKCGGYERRGG